MAVIKADLEAIKASEVKLTDLARKLSTAPDFVKSQDTSTTIAEAVLIYERILDGQKNLIKLCYAASAVLQSAYLEFSEADTGSGKMIDTL